MYRQAYNLIAQRDSQVMKGIGETARSDSGAMRSVAVVTMAFLPATFVAVSSTSYLREGKLIKIGNLQYELLQL